MHEYDRICVRNCNRKTAGGKRRKSTCVLTEPQLRKLRERGYIGDIDIDIDFKISFTACLT